MSANVTVIIHPDCLAHETPPGHPERVARLAGILAMLKSDLPDIQMVHSPAASDIQILYAHTQTYLNQLTALSPDTGIVQLDPDTYMNPHSLNAARHAAGAGIMGVDMVMSGQSKTVFCATRPPGHHAEVEKPMGFCLFANAYIAARHAQEAYGVARVAVIDFDVHHGNGTAAMIYHHKRTDIMLASSHQFPFWPGTGGPDDDDADGLVFNMPLPAHTGSDDFRAAWKAAFPRIQAFKPELLILSAGFDAHRDDPLAQMQLDADDFSWITQQLKAIQPRIVSLLEGGYNIEALASSVKAHLKILT